MFSTGFTHGFSPMCDIARWGKTMAPERGGVKDMILAEYIYPCNKVLKQIQLSLDMFWLEINNKRL